MVLCCCVLLIFVGFSFFFFKQKTAYEMRISDWSSDVCSSDLDPLDGEVDLLDRSRGLRAQREVSLPLHCKRVALARLLVELDVARLPLGREEIGLGPQGCRLAGVGGALVLEHGQLLAQELVEPCRRLGHGLGRGGRRSEEHTSELQSLMRISY